MRIAIFGLGFMGGVHLRALREVAGATLAAVFSNDERQLTGRPYRHAGQSGASGRTLRFFTGIKLYRDLAAVLGDADIDAVDLCLPTFMHEEVAVAALQRRQARAGGKADGAGWRIRAAYDRRGGTGRAHSHVRAGAAFLPRVRGVAQCPAPTRRGAERVLPAALRRSGLGRMAERPGEERRRRVRPVDSRRGYVPASFR